MKNFKIRVRFTHTPGNHTNPLDVILGTDILNPIGICEVFEQAGEIIGLCKLEVDVEDDLYVYYREDLIANQIHAIQLLEELLPDKEAFTILDLLR